MSTKEPANMRDNQLDGLRGLAAIGVVLFHAHYGALFEWMWTFVDLFFVLSGFLITRIVTNAIATGGFSLKNFMIRRALRIWPIYYATLLFCLLVVCINYVKTGLWEHTDGIATAPFFLQYTHHYLENSFNGGHEDFLIWFRHSWSIAVEEQFYLLMPLVLLLLKRNMNWALLIVAFLIPLAVFYRSEGAVYWLLVARMDALCIGVGLAFYWTWRKRNNDSFFLINRVCATFIIVGALVLIFIEYFPINLPYKTALSFSLLGFNIFFGAVVLTLMEGWLPKLNIIMSSNLMVFFGSISYALYLFHVPIRGILLHIVGSEEIATSPFWAQASYFGLSLCAAYVSKILIEDRVNKIKHKFPIQP